LEQAHAHLRPRLLAAPEHDHHLDLVALPQEPFDVALLGAVVMRVNLQAEADLFQHRVGLAAAGVAGLLGGLVLVLPVVHELRDRRARVRRDLDQVEVGFRGQPQGHLQFDNPHLFPGGAHEAHFRHSDAVVDPGFADDSLLVARIGVGARGGS
jgi:hypothetical protein